MAILSANWYNHVNSEQLSIPSTVKASNKYKNIQITRASFVGTLCNLRIFNIWQIVF